MKQNSLIFAVLAFFCLAVGQAEEDYNMVIPEQAPQMPQVQDGQLIGCWQGKPYVTISPLSLLFDDRK